MISIARLSENFISGRHYSKHRHIKIHVPVKVKKQKHVHTVVKPVHVHHKPSVFKEVHKHEIHKPVHVHKEEYHYEKPEHVHKEEYHYEKPAPVIVKKPIYKEEISHEHLHHHYKVSLTMIFMRFVVTFKFPFWQHVHPEVSDHGGLDDDLSSNFAFESSHP